MKHLASLLTLLTLTELPDAQTYAADGPAAAPKKHRLDTSFVDIKPPGYVDSRITGAVKSTVFVVEASEVVAFDDVTHKLTLASFGTHQAGDVLVFGAPLDKSVVKVTSLDSSSGFKSTYSCEPATIADVFTQGSYNYTVAPDFTSGLKVSSPQSAPLGIDAIDISGLVLCDVKVNGDGTIDVVNSSLMGVSLFEIGLEAVVKSDTAGVAGGHFKATVVTGSIDIVPTASFTTEIGSVGYSLHGRVDAIVTYTLEVLIETSGAVDFNFDAPLLPPVGVVIPTAAGIPIEALLEIPASFELHAEVNGTATMRYSSQYAYTFVTDYDSSVDPNPHFSAQSAFVEDDKGAEFTASGSIAATLYVEPTVTAKLFGLLGPLVWLQPHVASEFHFPLQPGEDELFVGVEGGCGIELGADWVPFIGTQSFKSGDLLGISPLAFDLLGPAGPGTNNPPIAYSGSLKVSAGSTTIELDADDADGDFLAFHVEFFPAHGTLGVLDTKNGTVSYKPHWGYVGPDGIAFAVHDGALQSNVANVSLTVQGGSPPNAAFYTVNPAPYVAELDASISWDDQTPLSGLMFRWDYHNDGGYDTAFSSMPTASHTYAFGGTYVVRLQVMDSDGMVDTAIQMVTVLSNLTAGELRWARKAGGNSGDYGNDIAALPDGSSLVTGNFQGAATFGAGGTSQVVLTSTGSEDVFVARYHPDGSLAWAKKAGGGGLDTGSSIAVLTDGSCLVTGNFQGTATFGAGEPTQTILAASGPYDIFVARYNTGGSLIWARKANTGGSDAGLAIASLLDGSCLVTGYFQGTATFGPGEFAQTILTASGAYDIFAARYHANGSLAWARKAGGSQVDYGFGIAVLPDGTFVVTGYFEGAAIFGVGEPAQTLLSDSGHGDIFVARYHADGSLAWARKAGGSSYFDAGLEIAALPDGSSLVTGYFYGTAIFGVGEPAQTTLSSPGSYGVFVARYNAAGGLAWARKAGGSFIDLGFGISALPDGSSLVTGSFQGTATFGAGEPSQTVLTSSGSEDVFVARYHADGSLAWARKAGGSSGDGAYGIASVPDGSALVTGYFQGAATFGSGEPAQIVLTSSGNRDTFVAKFNP